MVSHDAVLLSYGASRAAVPTPGAPLVLERSDPDFLTGVLEDAARTEPLSVLAASAPSRRGADRVLELYQPVHRAFHLIMLEVVCDAFGQPRLDPRKIESAGLTVRRLRSDGGVEGWLRDGQNARGWVDFRSTSSVGETTDPDPERRSNPLERFGLVRRGPDAWAESVTSLFSAPPSICDRARRTLLYGTLPLASSEVASQPLAAQAGDTQGGLYSLDEIVNPNHMPPYFLAGTGFSLGDIAGTYVSWNDVMGSSSAYFQKYLLMLQQLQIEFDAFNPDRADSRALLAVLKTIQLELPSDDGGPNLKSSADVELKRAIDVLVLEPDPAQSVRLPLAWPAISKDQADAFARATLTSLNARVGDILGREGRYDDPEARYHVRAFVRVRRDDGCPPAIYWSAPSEPFRILPWFENGVLPPLKVSLPKLDRDSIKKLKPNVTFKVPSALFQILNANKPKDFLEGKGKSADGTGIDWICAFNIPIITLCAFIVLFIFLVLLNIVFWWLPFIKICFPVPASLARKL